MTPQSSAISLLRWPLMWLSSISITDYVIHLRDNKPGVPKITADDHMIQCIVGLHQLAVGLHVLCRLSMYTDPGFGSMKMDVGAYRPTHQHVPRGT